MRCRSSPIRNHHREPVIGWQWRHPVVRKSSRFTLVAALAVLGGCSLLTDPFATNDFSGDPYPVPVDLTSGAIRVSSREPGAESRISIIDVLSPISIFDRGPNAQPRARQRTLFIVGAASATDSREVARAQVTGPFLEFHPCPTEPCEAGAEGGTFPFEVVLGADIFAGDALRLDLGRSSLSLLPDIAGNDTQRSSACDAVFSQPFRGGGTLLVGGTEYPFGGRRIAVSSCAAADPNAEARKDRGTDLLLVISTAVGVTVIGEVAYQRYRDTHPSAPALAALPPGRVTIPSGRLEGRVTALPSIALVGRATERGACGNVFAHRYLMANPTCRNVYPCDGAQRGVPSIVELNDPIPVLIIADSEPLLVGLRTELRPDQAEVDGVIGTSVLQRLQLDIDYPNNRLLARCSATGAKCSIRPELPDTSNAFLQRVQACLLTSP
jgi:hypothetical protein